MEPKLQWQGINAVQSDLYLLGSSQSRLLEVISI